MATFRVFDDIQSGGEVADLYVMPQQEAVDCVHGAEHAHEPLQRPRERQRHQHRRLLGRQHSKVPCQHCGIRRQESTCTSWSQSVAHDDAVFTLT